MPSYQEGTFPSTLATSGYRIQSGALMTALTVFLYLPILILARGELEVIVGLNYVADTLL